LRLSILKKLNLSPQNGPESLGTKKLANNSKFPEDYFETVEIGV